MNFVEALTKAYLAQPGRILPNALWKTRAIVARCRAELLLADDAATVTRLELWQPDKLFLYWDRDGKLELPQPRLAALTFALIHEEYAAAFPRETFPVRERYFRLTYRHSPRATVEDEPLPPAIATAAVGIAEAPGAVAAQVSRFIGRCYDDLHPSASTVAGWRDHPTFSPDLWLWLVDEQRGQPAALGIAEYDDQIREGSLEWIQVLPAYRQRGLGAALVAELLARLRLLGAAFTTVAGRLDDAGRAEALYRHCGFTGNDRWWLLRR